MHLNVLYQGDSGSGITSMLSCPRFVYSLHDCPLFFKIFADYASFGDKGVQKNLYVDIRVEG